MRRRIRYTTDARVSTCMRCTHCGERDGEERTVDFERSDRLELVLCQFCVGRFESDDSVARVTTLQTP